MRRIPALLLSAGLAAAPASAVAGPSQPAPGPGRSTTVERFEWSTAKGRLGATVMSLTPELRMHFGAPADRGVIVAQVEPGMAGAKAGIAVGDVIVSVRGQKIEAAPDVLAALTEARAGDRATIEVVRDRKRITLDATLTDSDPTVGWPSWLRKWMKPLEPFQREQTARN